MTYRDSDAQVDKSDSDRVTLTLLYIGLKVYWTLRESGLNSRVTAWRRRQSTQPQGGATTTPTGRPPRDWACSGSAAGRGQRARGGVASLPRVRAAAVVAAAAAARQRVPFRAEAGGGKVAGRRGAAPERSTRATASRGPASTDRPWTTSVSAGGGRRSGQGPAAASGLWGFRSHPGALLGCGACGPGLREPLCATSPEDLDPTLGSGTRPVRHGGRRLAPGAYVLLSCGTLTSLPHPQLRTAASRTRSRRLFPLCVARFCSLQATSHFADTPPTPPCQGHSPFPEPTRFTSQATGTLVRTTPPLE